MLTKLRALAVATLCLSALSSPAAEAGIFGGDSYEVDPIAFTVQIPAGYVCTRGTAVMTLAYGRVATVEGAAVATAQIARVDRKECAVQASSSANLVKVEVAAGELPLRAGRAEKPRQAGHVISLEFRAADASATLVVDLKYFDSMKRKETLREAAAGGLAKKVAAKYEGVALPLDRVEAGGDLQAARPEGGEPVELYCRVGALDEAPQSPTDDCRAAAFQALHEER